MPRPATERPSVPPGPVAPERFAVLQALLAYLLAACGEERTARDPGGRAARAVPVDPRRRARGAPLPPQPRQLRRRLLHGLRRAAGRHGARRQGALGRHVPRGAAPHAARGARDPARARVRRADDRRRRALAARARPQEARGDVRPVRPRADTRAARRRPRRSTSSRDARARHARAASSSRSSTRRRPTPRRRRGSSSRTRSSRELPELVRPHVGPDERRRAVVPARPDAQRDADAGTVRAARGLRADAAPRRAHGADPLREGRRSLGDRARRAAAHRRDGASRAARSASDEWLESEILSLRGEAVLARAGRAAAPIADARQGAREGVRRRAAPRARQTAS